MPLYNLPVLSSKQPPQVQTDPNPFQPWILYRSSRQPTSQTKVHRQPASFTEPIMCTTVQVLRNIVTVPLPNPSCINETATYGFYTHHPPSPLNLNDSMLIAPARCPTIVETILG